MHGQCSFPRVLEDGEQSGSFSNKTRKKLRFEHTWSEEVPPFQKKYKKILYHLMFFLPKKRKRQESKSCVSHYDPSDCVPAPTYKERGIVILRKIGLSITHSWNSFKHKPNNKQTTSVRSQQNLYFSIPVIASLQPTYRIPTVEIGFLSLFCHEPNFNPI